MKLLHLPRPQPDPEVIDELRELLGMAEAGDLDYIAYVATQPGGETITCEVGSRDGHRVYGLLHELAQQVWETDQED